MSATTSLGKVSRDVAEAFAWLTSPSHIAGEIATHEAAIRQGDTSPETAALLSDWRTIQRAQRLLVGQEGGEE